MPIVNATDLISKYCALVAVAFLGGHLSLAYGSAFARRWTVGMPGVVVLGLTCTGLFWTVLSTNAPHSSPQLLDFATQPSVRINTWLVLLYVAYIAFPLVRPAYLDSKENPLRTGRAASGMIAGGFALSLLRAGAYPVEWFGTGNVVYLYMLVSYVSTALVVVGLALFAYARRNRKVQSDLGSALSLD
jgi:hypothetical protein